MCLVMLQIQLHYKNTPLPQSGKNKILKMLYSMWVLCVFKSLFKFHMILDSWSFATIKANIQCPSLLFRAFFHWFEG